MYKAHIPNTRESAQYCISRPEARIRPTLLIPRPELFLLPTDHLFPTGRLDSNIPTEDCGYRNKPEGTILAHSGEVCRSLGLASWSNAFPLFRRQTHLLYLRPQSSYHEDPLTLGTNHLHLQLCLT